MKKILLMISFLALPMSSWAGNAEINHAEFIYRGGSWLVNVTLKHADTGWEHYADGWRVVDAKGNVLGKRTLYHPHVNEQPFTRSLNDVKIPADTKQVFVEAHDNVHGWNKDRVVVNLQQTKGERFSVRR